MRASGLLSVSSCVVLAAGMWLTGSGCRSQQPAPVVEAPRASTISPEKLASLRESYRKQYPAAQIGQVMAVKPEESVAAVGDVNVKDFRVGDPITFINADEQRLGVGTVEAIGEFLRVKYDQPGAGERAPEIGDLAVGHLAPPRK